MSEPHDEVERRGREAGARVAEPTGPVPPDLDDLVRVGRLRRFRRVAIGLAVVVALVAAGDGLASASGPGPLGWLVVGLLVVVLVGTWILCAHAGGHALFVPLPALLLAILWVLAVAGGRGGASWALAALSAVTASGAMVVGGATLTQQLRLARPAPDLAGQAGVTLTPLEPLGVVRVAAETWSARSLSGPLPVGSPVHVVRADGLRLDVWSEAGDVPNGLATPPAASNEQEQS